MRLRTSSLGVLAAVLLAGCFRGEFVEGTSCQRDSDCYPKFACVPTDPRVQATPPPPPYDGTCLDPPLANATSSESGASTSETGNTDTASTQTTGTGSGDPARSDTAGSDTAGSSGTTTGG